MKVSIRNGFEKGHSSDDPCLLVVIDVFRASTTALALLEVGVGELVIANDLSVVKRYHAEGFAVISEIFDLGIDNSPTQVLKGDYQGKKTLLKTANLTTAIAENYKASTMIICGFNNITAVSKYIIEQNLEWIEIIPAGLMKKVEENCEDSECAQQLKSLLTGEKYEVDWQTIQDKIEDRKNKGIKSKSHIDDLQHAIKLDLNSIIPLVKKLDEDSFSVVSF